MTKPIWPEEHWLATRLRDALRTPAARVLLVGLAFLAGAGLFFQLRRGHLSDQTTNDASALVDRAHEQYSRGEFAEAARTYTRAVEKDPLIARRISVLMERGWSYTNSGNAAAAVPDFTGALEISPEYSFAFLGRAAALHRLGKFPHALSDYSTPASLCFWPNVEGTRKQSPRSTRRYVCPRAIGDGR